MRRSVFDRSVRAELRRNMFYRGGSIVTSLERKAALLVAAATAGVIVSGVKLLQRHTRYIAQKAAATFGTEEEKSEDEDQTA